MPVGAVATCTLKEKRNAPPCMSIFLKCMKTIVTKICWCEFSTVLSERKMLSCVVPVQWLCWATKLTKMCFFCNGDSRQQMRETRRWVKTTLPLYTLSPNKRPPKWNPKSYIVSFWHVQYIKFHFLCPRFAFNHFLCRLVLFLGRFSYLVSHFQSPDISYHVLSHAVWVGPTPTLMLRLSQLRFGYVFKFLFLSMGVWPKSYTSCTCITFGGKLRICLN